MGEGDIFIDNPVAGAWARFRESGGISERGWRCDIVLGSMGREETRRDFTTEDTESTE
jgi:hypothetical protein